MIECKDPILNKRCFGGGRVILIGQSAGKRLREVGCVVGLKVGGRWLAALDDATGNRFDFALICF